MPSLIRLLLINKQLGFSVRTKQALEQIGGFEVTPFTTIDTALENLKQQRYDVALVDFTLPGISGPDAVKELRDIQTDLAIIASPDLPEVISSMRGMQLNGIIDVPCSARALLPVIEKALKKRPSTQSGADSETMPATSHPSNDDSGQINMNNVLVIGEAEDFPDDSQTLDVDMSNVDRDNKANSPTIEFTLKGEMGELRQAFSDSSHISMDTDSNQAVNLFQQLAAEEPPMPDMEENGTITDLKQRLSGTDLYGVAEQIMEDHTKPQPPILPEQQIPDEERESTPAEIILRSIQTDDEDVDALLDDMLNDLEEQYSEDKSNSRIKPAWLKDVERYIREPDFLDVSLPSLEGAITADTTNVINDGDLAAPIIRSTTTPPPPGIPGMPQTKTPKPVDLPEAKKSQPKQEQTTKQDAPKADLKKLPPQQQPQLPSPEKQAADEEAEIAQLALSLTQATLESAAVATLLAKGNNVVAYSGDLPLEDIAKLHETIIGDWDAKPNETRLRFATLNENGQDYMLFSRQTENDYTLSMIFNGNQPLRNIRQQGDRLLEALFTLNDENEAISSEVERKQIDELYQLEALAAQEEDEALDSTEQLILDQQATMPHVLPAPTNITEAKVITPPKTDNLIRYTYLWMLNSPDRALSEESAQNIVRKMDEWLTSIGWGVEILQVYEDYVYLMADVPDDMMAHEIIGDLKDFSAKVVAQIESVEDINTLWADSYFVLNPGRELHQAEIQRYINFERRR